MNYSHTKFSEIPNTLKIFPKLAHKTTTKEGSFLVLPVVLFNFY